MIGWLRSFLYDVPAVIVLDGRHAGAVDPDLAERNRQRIEQAKQKMGARWVCARPLRRRSVK